jgi:SAM-dependent methyltransferase
MRTNQEQNSAIANYDEKTVESFGHQWSVYDQSQASDVEQQSLFDRYFSLMKWDELPAQAQGFDMGCGTGRWAKLVATRPHIARLVCIDPAGAALDVARKNLADHPNCEFLQASVDETGIASGSMDFGYAIGVLHHIPDTAAAINSCADLLKPGAPLLLYLYYKFDHKPRWYKALWRVSDVIRRGIASLPLSTRILVCEIIAALVYWPLARVSKGVERCGADVTNWPLSDYRQSSFYRMRHNARDRFGTGLEQRFTKEEIGAMMQQAGLQRIAFRAGPPYWCVIGYKA